MIGHVCTIKIYLDEELMMVPSLMATDAKYCQVQSISKTWTARTPQGASDSIHHHFEFSYKSPVTMLLHPVTLEAQRFLDLISPIKAAYHNVKFCRYEADLPQLRLQ